MYFAKYRAIDSFSVYFQVKALFKKGFHFLFFHSVSGQEIVLLNYLFWGKTQFVGRWFQFSRSVVSDYVTPWTTALQPSLSITNSRSSLKPMSIESVMPSNHLILCRPLLLLPSIFPSIRVFSNESAFHIRWPKLEFQLQHQSFQWTLRTDLL